MGIAGTLNHSLFGRHEFRGSPYHYVPTEGVAITFIVLFAISTVIHLCQAFHYRMAWLLPTVCLCGFLEVLGWSARLWSSLNPPFSSPFEMQITCTILGPTPFLAANFVTFGIIIQRLGTQYSRLSPKWYTILFCTCDVISLVIQAVGGGKAAVAAGNGLDPTLGGNIMLGGISFQLLTISMYAICAIEFYIRYSQDWPILRQGSKRSDVKEPMSAKITLMSVALLVSTTFLLIRAVYRTVELSDGWNGRIISTQVLFNVLDGAMIVLTMSSMNLAHPGLLLGRGSSLAKELAKAREKRISGKEDA